MDYFVSSHSSSTDSPAMSASNDFDLISVDDMPVMDESALGSLWLNDDAALLWDLDASEGFGAGFDPGFPRKASQATSVSTNQSDITDGKRKSSVGAPEKVTRRREQNRASQRLFRERKINHVRRVEQQLEELNEKYQDLIVSFNNQTKEKVAMLDLIAKLTAKLASKD